MKQITGNLLMVRPACFGFNPETAANNVFQKNIAVSPQEIHANALNEFDQVVEILQSKGIKIHLLHDTAQPVKPDAIFPNNWISFGHQGRVTIFPMQALNRRAETFLDWEKLLAPHYVIHQITDLRQEALTGRYLEGTGSIVFDHDFKLAYASRSCRTDDSLLAKYCQIIGYEPVIFDAKDPNDCPYYHTNVIMSIGEGFAVVCLASIANHQQKEKIKKLLQKTGKELIEISHAQVNAFAGNILQIKSGDGRTYLAMSQRAFHAYHSNQLKKMRNYGELIVIPIPTIEQIGGGSIRCMLAEIFLPVR